MRDRIRERERRLAPNLDGFLAATNLLWVSILVKSGSKITKNTVVVRLRTAAGERRRRRQDRQQTSSSAAEPKPTAGKGGDRGWMMENETDSN